MWPCLHGCWSATDGDCTLYDAAARDICQNYRSHWTRVMGFWLVVVWLGNDSPICVVVCPPIPEANLLCSLLLGGAYCKGTRSVWPSKELPWATFQVVCCNLYYSNIIKYGPVSEGYCGCHMQVAILHLQVSQQSAPDSGHFPCESFNTAAVDWVTTP